MRKLAVLSVGLLIGIAGIAPAMAQIPSQESGVANTAEDFKSPDSSDGILGSNVDIWDVFHRARSIGGAQADEGFYRSQNRRINSQAESLRDRQRAIMQQRAAEANATGASEAPSLDRFAQ
ncbi:MAG: hypothetical protein WBA76_01960 [Phormidesmis sp.]